MLTISKSRKVVARKSLDSFLTIALLSTEFSSTILIQNFKSTITVFVEYKKCTKFTSSRAKSRRTVTRPITLYCQLIFSHKKLIQISDNRVRWLSRRVPIYHTASQSCPRVTFLEPDPTRPGETLTRPDPTRDF